MLDGAVSFGVCPCTVLSAYVDHRLKPLWEIIMAIYDGYCLYCFFGLVLLGTGDYRSVLASLFSKPPLTVRFLVVPLRFSDADAMYKFFSRSVMQVIVTRPVCLAISALLAIANPAGPGVKLLRALGIVCLAYAVISIGKMYHLVHQHIWKAFSPVLTFFVVKTFILLIALQDFALQFVLITPRFHLTDESATAWHVYAVLVAVESILYLLLVRNCFHFSKFQAFNSDAPRLDHHWKEFARAVLHFRSVIDESDVREGNTSSESSPIRHLDQAAGLEGVDLRVMRAPVSE